MSSAKSSIQSVTVCCGTASHKSIGDALSRLKAERDENVCREPFLPSEAVALGVKLEALEKPKAKERQIESGKLHGRGAKGSGKLPEPKKGDTRDKVGAAVGMSGKTIEKAKAVVESGDKELIAEMNETGKVERSHRKLRAKKRVEEEEANALMKKFSEPSF